MDKIVMTDLEYLDCAEALLKAVETCCDHINDHSDADVDNQRTGAMVTLSFANRSQIIINLQKPLQGFGWPRRPVAFTTNAKTAAGWTPKTAASFLRCSALAPRSKRGSRFNSGPEPLWLPALKPAHACPLIAKQLQNAPPLFAGRQHLHGRSGA